MTADRDGIRVLVAHNAPRARTGGMSRIMGFIHDRLEACGIATDYLTADDVPPWLRGGRTRITFPLLVWQRARAAAASGTPYDVINVHEPQSACVSTWRKAHGAAVVVTSHGLEQVGWDIASRSSPAPALSTRLLYPLTSLTQSRIGLTRADHVLCLSGTDRRTLVERFAIPSARITRIFPGVDPVFGAAAVSRDYSRAATLVFAGTWTARKGTRALVAAFESLHAGGLRPRLVILGGGVPAGSMLQAFSPALREYVSCVAAEDDAAAARILARCDVFLLPSLFEGTPLTLVEAMASGLPIVTTRVAGMRDVIRHDVNGLLVTPDEDTELVQALRRLLNDAALRATIGTAAARDAAQLTWEAAAAPVAGVYRALVQGR